MVNPETANDRRGELNAKVLLEISAALWTAFAGHRVSTRLVSDKASLTIRS
jgi:hypothetical protein